MTSGPMVLQVVVSCLNGVLGTNVIPLGEHMFLNAESSLQARVSLEYFIYIFYVFEHSVLPACMSVPHVCLVHMKTRTHWISWNEITDGCNCHVDNKSLEEQTML